MKLTFYTDGASRGNPGRGGWGVYAEIVNDKGEEKTFSLSGGKPSTTNNRMELTASIQALSFLDKVILNKYFVKPETLGKEFFVIIKTDSKYVKTGITEWIINWEKNNWRAANKKPVLNKDLWQELLSLKDIINDKLKSHNFPEIVFEYVEGHAGIEGNEMADKLATEAADKFV
jgi:ribonuclease HI